MSPPPPLLPRRRLLARLEGLLEGGVALVQGEPGSGKSTLLRLLGGQTKIPVVVVTLDERAEDPAFLVGAIGRALDAVSGARPAADDLAVVLAALGACSASTTRTTPPPAQPRFARSNGWHASAPPASAW
jgi:ATP/maltotriose-dependent transcriptional regulator MalT